MQLVEHRLGQPLEHYFREQYVDRRRSQAEIAADLDVDVGSVSRWMARLNIGARRGRPRAKALIG